MGMNKIIYLKDCGKLLSTEEKFRNNAKTEWIFRAQPWGRRKSPLPIASSLERACDDLSLAPKYALTIEKKLIREFASCYHHYVSHPPPQMGETLEWLALMRHHGTPTRLVDFTWSFFVAALFAGLDNNGDSAIWCINKSWLGQRAEEAIRSIEGGEELVKEHTETRSGKSFRAIFITPQTKFVSAVNPIRFNERLAIQQGLFLAPGDITTKFQSNLPLKDKDADENVRVVRIKASSKPYFLKKLHRMGLHRSALFPGLDGFAQSLRERMLLFGEPYMRTKTDIDLAFI